MDESVSLSTAFSNNIENTRKAQRVANQTAQRLATGLRVNTPYDDPADFYSARSLANRVGELGALKGALQLEQNTYQTAAIGYDAIARLTRQLDGIAQSAQFAQSAQERQDLAAQFNELRSQIDAIASDTRFGATSPLNGLSASALGIGDASSDYNDFASLDDIAAAQTALRSATNDIRRTETENGRDISVSQIREDFADGLSNILREGEAALVQADLNEEAAYQLAAQVRTDLSFQSQRLLAEGESLLMGLFSG